MSRVAKIFHNILTGYCLIGMLPVVLLLALVKPDNPASGPPWLVMSSGVLGMTWFVSLAYFVVAFSSSGRVRQSIVSILSGLTELDERERELTGRAARNTFITMTAVILLCILLAIFSMTVRQIPPDHGSASFSLGLVTLSAEDFISVTPEPGGTTRWEVHILPQTYVVPLVCLLLIQVVAFRFFSKPIRRPGND
jgi:hypothetical protein